MSVKPNMQLMASYNQWMNRAIYQAATQLEDADLREDKGAFFRSILGTLNHNIVGDIIWLKRFADHFTTLFCLDGVRTLERPARLDSELYADFNDLQDMRFHLDLVIIEMIDDLTDGMLASLLLYKNTKGIAHSQCFALVLQHFFNHQTHHRGQITTLLSQMGLDVGATDLILTIPNQIEL
ncbi:DinB family protein [Marinomonas transparens]|uniref:Damage-inducible protein DinB n=1 Tax=Marinomonas transparens TaxID=2795388 RepID=A0A934JNR6_9GAMM|nr:DinB family protein [Marinomonas transparens]MBJ7539176.1 damage-inducible protein DinB [Marinomonas transparens]